MNAYLYEEICISVPWFFYILPGSDFFFNLSLPKKSQGSQGTDNNKGNNIIPNFIIPTLSMGFVIGVL